MPLVFRYSKVRRSPSEVEIKANLILAIFIHEKHAFTKRKPAILCCERAQPGLYYYGSIARQIADGHTVDGFNNDRAGVVNVGWLRHNNEICSI